MIHRTRFLLLAAALFALAGCGGLNTLAHMESPTVDVTGVKLLGTSLAGADVLVQFRVDNPNDVDLVLDGIDYKLRLNGEQLLDGHFDKQVQILASDRTAVELPVKIRFDDLARVIRTLQGQKTPSTRSTPISASLSRPRRGRRAGDPDGKGAGRPTAPADRAVRGAHRPVSSVEALCPPKPHPWPLSTRGEGKLIRGTLQ